MFFPRVGHPEWSLPGPSSFCQIGLIRSVSGGWFDHEGLSPFKTSINGCTWGGRAIKVDVVAACGLFLEFGNQLITSRIQKVDVVRYEGVQHVH